ncbi:LpxT activity modulator PmrR [Salmonella enterica]
MEGSYYKRFTCLCSLWIVSTFIYVWVTAD